MIRSPEAGTSDRNGVGSAAVREFGLWKRCEDRIGETNPILALISRIAKALCGTT